MRLYERFYDSLRASPGIASISGILASCLAAKTKFIPIRNSQWNAEKLGDKLNEDPAQSIVKDRERFLACAGRINLLTAFKLHRLRFKLVCWGSICNANRWLVGWLVSWLEPSPGLYPIINRPWLTSCHQTTDFLSRPPSTCERL